MQRSGFRVGGRRRASLRTALVVGCTAWCALLVGAPGVSAQGNTDVQARAGDIVSLLQQRLGAGYAGVWFDTASGRMKVPLAPGADEAAARQALAERGILDDTDLLWVTWTWAQLEAAQPRVNAVLAPLFAARKVMTALSPADNAVVVNLSSAATAEERVLVEAARQAAGVAVVVVEMPPSFFDVSPAVALLPPSARSRVETLARGLDAKARTQLGNRYACVTVPGANAGSPSIRLFVTSPKAREQAQRLARAQGAGAVTTVRVVAPRSSLANRQAVQAELRRAVIARRWRNVSLGVENWDRRSTCPRALINVYPGASPAQRAWAAQQVRRHGRDRVRVHEVQPGDVVPNAS